MPRSRQWTIALASAVLPMALIPLTSPSALAHSAAADYPVYTYAIKVTSTDSTVVLYNKQLASCSAGVGGTCSLSRSFSVARTIQTKLGVTRAIVAAEIGFSTATTTTVTSQCNSPKFTKSGQVYRAYPQGIKKRYNITRKMYYNGKLENISYSSGEAFNPQGVYCRMT
ncbi:hypothetical protein [Nonomuraea sp. JJY05]|uniref:hypothetical protein n=1 Tax=Nonomuraea sp. JJY05 TaxID=3350255 RepID=UPI00373F3030